MNLNKKTRTALAMILAVVMVLAAAGCGAKEAAEVPYDYNLEEYVKVGEYKGLEYTAFEVEITDAELEEAIDEVLAEYMTHTEIPEGVVKSGDYISIKYTMEIDGEQISGTDAQNYVVKVGDSGLMPDVDKALLGAEVGKTITVDTAFAEDYDINPEVAGKSVTYEIAVQSIVIPVYQELTDEFAKETLGVKDAAEYRELMKESMYESRLDDARYAAGEEIWNQVVEASEVLQYPEKEVSDTEVILEDNFKTICEQNDMTFEEALSDILQMNETEFKAEMEQSAKDGVKEEMILYAIARENDLEMTEKEIQEYMDLLLETNGMTDEEFTEQYGVNIREFAENSGVLISMLYEEVFGFLVDQGVAR